MCLKCYEKSIQEVKKISVLSHICKIDPRNSNFGRCENMEILGPYHPVPATVFRPKMARISMIGSSGGSKTPAHPTQGVDSARERVPIEQQHWGCEICKGNWYETDEFGADWMINKVQILMRKTGALSHKC